MSIDVRTRALVLKNLKEIQTDLDRLVELISELQSIDEDAPDAEANKTTISDNNGGRIKLGYESPNTKVIKKV